jgi:hypothetical protein
MPAPGQHPGTQVTLELDAVIIAVTGDDPRLVVVRPTRARPGQVALPSGELDAGDDRTLERGFRRIVSSTTGLELEYVEQLYTFGDRERVPDARVVSVGYLALAREVRLPSPEASWEDLYAFFPWEDWRLGRPAVLDTVALPALSIWIDHAADPVLRKRRHERVAIAFGLEAPWDGERVLDRYELLYEADLVPEAGAAETGANLHPGPGRATTGGLGRPMILDHRRIAAIALSRLRGKLRYRPLVFELMPPVFTLLQLQRAVEALAGVAVHKQNFRRFIDREGLVDGTGQFEEGTGGRPAELFRFRRDVLTERPSRGLTVPALRPLH